MGDIVVAGTAFEGRLLADSADGDKIDIEAILLMRVSSSSCFEDSRPVLYSIPSDRGFVCDDPCSKSGERTPLSNSVERGAGSDRSGDMSAFRDDLEL